MKGALNMAGIMDLAVVLLRILMPVYTVFVVYQCFASMRRRRRPERPLVMLQNLESGVKIPVLFWENSIGRNRSSDIVIDDPAVSRNQCVLLRRKEGWFLTDTNSKSGTYINDERIEGRTQVCIDDTIGIGNSDFVLGVPRGASFKLVLLQGCEQALNQALQADDYDYAVPYFYGGRGCVL